MRYIYSKGLLVILAFLISAVLVQTSTAQRRDHLTAAEVELVRDVQEVDFRMDLFVKAIERRLWVLGGIENLTREQQKRVEKDLDKWGELPQGSRADLLSDIEKILFEAVDKIEDVYENEPKSERLPFAFYILADFSEALLPKLEELSSTVGKSAEIGTLERAKRLCHDVLEARDAIPRPTGKRPKPKRTR